MNRWSFFFLSTLASGLVLSCSDDDGDPATMTGELNPASDGAGDATNGSLSFFVTSRGSGEAGGNLGGLEGADAMCQELAEAAGAGDRTWRAYLSTDTVDAISRIGAGPWFNAEGVEVASDIDDLVANGISNGDPQLILDETGEPAPANEHDILTGTDEDGTAAVGLNCDNWTSNSADLTENPRVGHSDIPGNPMFSPSWNAAHVSANCSEEGLRARGGAGRLYCFAAD